MTDQHNTQDHNKQSMVITTPAQEFWQGVRDEMPLMLGVVPFGMVFGVLGVEVGLDPLVVMAMSFVIFGGASQVIFAQMVAAGAGSLVIAGTVGIKAVIRCIRCIDVPPRQTGTWRPLCGIPAVPVRKRKSVTVAVCDTPSRAAPSCKRHQEHQAPQ